MTCGVYLITCEGNQKLYVGSSANIEERWVRHRQMLRNNRHDNRYLQRAWNKYGVESFAFTIVAETSFDERERRERQEISYRGCIAPNGFNVRPPDPARDGWTASLEMRAQMSAALTGKKYGPMSPEARAAHSASLRGKKRSISSEWRAKIAEANRGKKRTPEQCAAIAERKRGQKRKPFSPEWCANISAANKGRVVSDEARANLSAALKGRKVTRDMAAKQAAAQRGKQPKKSPEWLAKIAAAHRGMKRKPITCARISAVTQARKAAIKLGRPVQIPMVLF